MTFVCKACGVPFGPGGNPHYLGEGVFACESADGRVARFVLQELLDREEEGGVDDDGTKEV